MLSWIYLAVELVRRRMRLYKVVCAPFDGIKQVTVLTSVNIGVLERNSSPCQCGHCSSHWKPEFYVVTS